MLIGINGKAGAGKDTVADFLVNNYGFKRYAFADALRHVALAIDPIVGKFTPHDESESRFTHLSEIIGGFGWNKAKREIPEVRRLLQVIGTEAGRQLLGENVWVDIINRKWCEDGMPDAVITDMRFHNEFMWVEECIDGVTLKVVRPNNPDAIAPTHASEQYDPNCQYLLVNDGTLEDLEYNLTNLMRVI